ncbi:MAG: glycoside hydrolase 43 family protein [Verrucomicrobia bacterium TMED40]|nr:MAG: glycoside hydrolase 43 family protein [Verrucomicrobia bacterium TMED40]
MITNPILPGFNPDPSICRVGDDYYIATSTFEWFPGVQIHHSKDLVHWELIGQALNEKRMLDLQGVPSSGGVWAPALSHADGQFYLCYTVVHQHEAATKDTPNFLTTAPSIDGPWSDPVFINSSGFDPSLFHDIDGKKYWLNMVWDHRPDNHPFYGIILQEYDPQSKSLTGKPELIFKGSSLGLTEGPHLYQRNGFYYLLTAEGGTEYEHAVTLARSHDLRGPFELHPQNPILTSSGKPELALQKAGHASLVETQGGEWYMPHLCGRPLPGTKRCNLGRETAIQKVEWRADDWLYLAGGENDPKPQVPAPQLKPQPFPKLPERLPFDSPHYATPRGPSSSVVRGSNGLTLTGRESLESNFEQAMLARRLTQHRATATTKISFHPQSFQQMAGIAAYYNTFLFHYLHLSHDEEQGLCLQIHSCDDGKSSFPLGSEIIPVSTGELFLRATFEDLSLQFFFSEDGETFQKAGPALDASVLSDDHGEHWGFTGTFVALACQDLTGAGQPAHFSFLELSC